MNFIKYTTAACAALSLALAAPALAAEKEKGDKEKGAASESGKVTASDKCWAHMAAVSDKAELTLAKAAQSKSQNEQVKQHAQQMLQDHGKTTAELTKWAQANHVELNATLPPEKQAVVKEIESKSGADFDKAYMNHEVEGHRHAAVHFQNGVEFLQNQELKQFAQENQPTINQHLSMTETHAGAQRTAIGGAQGGNANPSANAPANRPANAPAGGQVGTQGNSPARPK
jgi:putative membrane protein